MRARGGSASEAGRRSENVAVLGKALDVLEALAAAKELGLTDVATRAATSKGAAFRILGTLEQRGYVEKDPITKRYRAAAALVALSNAFVAGQNLASSARATLEALRRECGETVNLGVLSNGQVLYVDVLESTQDLRMAAQAGRREPLHCTALGKALLSRLPMQEARRLLAAYRRERLTTRTLVDLNELMDELEGVRQRGYAIDNGEIGEGIRCVGAAVVDDEGGPVAAISISGPASRVDEVTAHRLGDRLQLAVAEVSRRLGHASDSATVAIQH
jgi:IclR family acetate operon transcriptional repressor